MSQKKLCHIATECNDDLHATFIAQMAQYEGLLRLNSNSTPGFGICFACGLFISAAEMIVVMKLTVLIVDMDSDTCLGPRKCQ